MCFPTSNSNIQVFYPSEPEQRQACKHRNQSEHNDIMISHDCLVPPLVRIPTCELLVEMVD